MGNARSQCRSVLLVEDNEVDAYLTYNVLQESETTLDVEIVSTAEEGLARVWERAYDLVVCDYRLPGMNGLSFLKLAKKIRATMPVILLTGYPSQELEAQVIHHGLCTYLSKAVDAQTLSRVIKEVLFPHELAISV
jgi:two-component system response regulator HydG